MIENKNTGWRTKIVTSASIGLTVWLSLYIAFWMRRSGCHVRFTMDCNDAPLAALERFVSLWWVRDYQEILAALIALGAAFFVGLPVHRQLREMQRQSSAAAIGSIRIVAHELEKLQEEFQELRRPIQNTKNLLEEYYNADGKRLLRSWSNSMDHSTSGLQSFANLLQLSANRRTTNLLEMERSGINLSKQLKDALNDLHLAALLARQADLSGKDTGQTHDPVAYANALRHWQKWEEWQRKYEYWYNQNTKDVWRKVRSLEIDAIGSRDRQP